MEKTWKIIKEMIPYVVIILVVLLVKRFIFTPVVVNGGSMLDTLHDGDIMILDKIGMKIGGIDRFDIVVIQTDRKSVV